MEVGSGPPFHQWLHLLEAGHSRFLVESVHRGFDRLKELHRWIRPMAQYKQAPHTHMHKFLPSSTLVHSSLPNWLDRFTQSRSRYKTPGNDAELATEHI
jgi:hypothetical protein